MPREPVRRHETVRAACRGSASGTERARTRSSTGGSIGRDGVAGFRDRLSGCEFPEPVWRSTARQIDATRQHPIRFLFVMSWMSSLVETTMGRCTWFPGPADRGSPPRCLSVTEPTSALDVSVRPRC